MFNGWIKCEVYFDPFCHFSHTNRHIRLEWWTVWRNASHFAEIRLQQFRILYAFEAVVSANGQSIACDCFFCCFILDFPVIYRGNIVCLTARIKLYLILRCAIVHKVIRYINMREQEREREKKVYLEMCTQIFSQNDLIWLHSIVYAAFSHHQSHTMCIAKRSTATATVEKRSHERI